MNEPMIFPDFEAVLYSIQKEKEEFNNRIKSYGDVICEYFNVPRENLLKRGRKRPYVYANHTMIFILLMVEGLKLYVVSSMTGFGNSNLYNSVDNVMDMYDTEPNFRIFMNLLIGEKSMKTIKERYVPRKR